MDGAANYPYANPLIFDGWNPMAIPTRSSPIHAILVILRHSASYIAWWWIALWWLVETPCSRLICLSNNFDAKHCKEVLWILSFCWKRVAWVCGRKVWQIHADGTHCTGMMPGEGALGQLVHLSTPLKATTIRRPSKAFYQISGKWTLTLLKAAQFKYHSLVLRILTKALSSGALKRNSRLRA